MQSIISYQNQAFYIHLDQVVGPVYVHIYKNLQLEKHIQVDRSNFIKIDYPDAKGKFQVKIACPNDEITKTIII